MGAAKPIMVDIHPDIKPARGWYILPKKLYSPPDRGRAAPSSAYVAAPHRAAMPPIAQSKSRRNIDCISSSWNPIDVNTPVPIIFAIIIEVAAFLL